MTVTLPGQTISINDDKTITTTHLSTLPPLSFTFTKLSTLPAITVTHVSTTTPVAKTVTATGSCKASTVTKVSTASAATKTSTVSLFQRRDGPQCLELVC